MGTYIASSTDNYSFDASFSGYQEIAYVDLLPANGANSTSRYIDQVDLTIGCTSSQPLSKSNSFNFYCNINFNIDLSFTLPNFLSKPSPNLTLFKKADEFSYEISRLNDTLIQIFQQMGCCSISDEYNKTVVPIFRYLASSKEHEDCGNSPNLEPDSCGGDSNFMKEILKVVKNITKVYTAIEPLFCLISPIPGNPWLPIDFNWMAPVLPYIQTFQQFMDKIMSGSLFDIIINPIKNLNNTLQNCTSVQTKRSISVLNRYSDKDISKDIINTMDEIKTIKEELDIGFDKSDILLTHQESLVKSVTELQNKKKLEKSIWEVMKYKSPISAIPTNATSEKYKLQQIRNPGSGICRCLLQLSGLEVRLPKFPKAQIRILPSTDTQIYNIYSNDLLKITNETAFAIMVSDIIPEDTTGAGKNNIKFTQALSTDANFIKRFGDYIDKNGGPGRFFYKAQDVITSIDSSDINPAHEITQGDFATTFYSKLPYIQFDYTNKEEYIKETIEEYNPFISTTLSFVTMNGINKNGTGKASDIIASNKEIILKINELETLENMYITKLVDIKRADNRNWEDLKYQADAIIKDLNISKAGDFSWNNIETLKQQNLYLDIFGSYLKPDINIDIFDTRLIEKLFLYGDIQNTPIYEIANQYVEKRMDLIFFDEISGDNYKTFAEKSIEDAYLQMKNLISKYNLKFTPDIDTDNRTIEITNVYEALKTSSDYEQYFIDYNDYKNAPFGNLFLEKLAAYQKDVYIMNNVVLINENIWYNILMDIKTKMISDIPNINTTGTLYNYFYFSIKILQCESYKLTLFKILEDNIAYDFYLTEYPNIECTCETIVCKLIQWVIDFLLYYINMFLAWLLKLLLDWLIPKWLRALIDLIIYKLKCILQIVYMKDTMDLIDQVYKNFLNNLKYRVNNYPYENCVNTALDDALEAINQQYQDDTGLDNQITYEDAKKELKDHKVSIEFVDINKRSINNCTMDEMVSVNIKVTYDVGSEIQSILLTDSTVLGDSTAIELVDQESNIYDKQRIYVVDIPLEKIISGKLKAVVKSYKSFADIQTVYDNTELIILDFIDSGLMRFILSDYKTADYNIFLERNNETLNVSFNILQTGEYGDPTQNMFLIKNYIESIVLYDKAPEGTERLPSIILKEDDLVNNTHYSEETKLFSIIVDCTNFFPSGRDIYGIITSHSIYHSTNIIINNSIYCQGEDISMDGGSDNTGLITGTFNDTIIYSGVVTVPNTLNQTEEDALNNNIQVRQNTPLIFNCTLSFGNGTSANIIKLNEELHDIWAELGLI